MRNETSYIALIYVSVLVCITLLIAGSFIWNAVEEKQNAYSYALTEARASFNKDLLYRRWAAMHGGVYVPVTEKTRPNPLLSFVENRDIETDSGKLTLINPAYMTRQVFNIAQEQYGVKGHITSLNPLRPENKADEWEQKALRFFEDGRTEHSSIEIMNDTTYLRYMHVMRVEQKCIKCHAHQGYKVGDIRGGISVSVPFNRYFALSKHRTNQLAISHSLIYLIFLSVSYYAYRRLFETLKKRQEMQLKIIANEQNLIKQNEKLQHANKLAEQNEYRLKIAQEASNSGAWEWDITNNTFYWPDEFLHLFGFTKNTEFSIDTWRKAVHPEDLEDAERNFQEALSKNSELINDYRIIHPDQSVRWIRAYGKTIFHDDKPIRMVGLCLDITAQKMFERELISAKTLAETSEDKFRTTTQNIPGMIYRAKVDWTVELMLNSELICGYPPNMFLTSTIKWHELILDEDRERVFEEGLSITKGQISIVQEYRIKAKDGGIRYVKDFKTSRFNGDKIVGVDGIVIDNTYSKQIEHELVTAKDKAEENDRLKSAFLHNISHEIRTPMNAIIGFSKLLENPDLPADKLKSFTSIIINSSNQLLSIITDILTISSIETNQEKVAHDIINLVELFEQIQVMFAQQFQDKNIVLRSKINFKNSPAIIETDKTKLTQILCNLISNSYKFTREGSIEFGCTLQKSEVNFYVSDTGIGIKPEHQQKIFDRFYQVDSQANRSFGGTGLGLTICSEFVQMLKGNIWLKSEPEKGTIFHFSLPHNVNIPEDVSEYKRDLNTDDKPATILVAEDEEINYALIFELLNNRNYTVIQAQNGQEAIDLFNGNTDINLILMDIKMPVMEGHEAAKKIKTINPDIPIIAQTAYALPSEIRKYDKFFDGYLTKPILANALYDILSKFI